MGHVMQLVHAKISCYTPPLYAFLRASTPLPRCPRWTLKEIPRFIQGVQTLDRIERALNRCSQYRAINNKIFEIRIDQNPVFKDAQRDFLSKCNEFSTQNWNICTSICNQEYRGQDRVFKDTLKETEVFFLDIEGIIFFLFSRFSKFFSPPCIQACMGWTRERVVVGAHCRAKRASCLVANHRCWDELGHDLAYDFFVNHRCRHQHSLCSTTGIQYGRYIQNSEFCWNPFAV